MKVILNTVLSLTVDIPETSNTVEKARTYIRMNWPNIEPDIRKEGSVKMYQNIYFDNNDKIVDQDDWEEL